MSKARIVTDSSAELPSEAVEALGIAVVPWRVRLGPDTLVDGPDLRSRAFYREMIKRRLAPTAVAPTPRQFSGVYARLAKETGEIISIHASSQLVQAVQMANQARVGLLGSCQVNVIDSQFISRALGILVVEAAKAAQAGMSGPEIIRLVHGLIPRIYFAFYAETMDYLRQNSLLNESRDASVGLSRSLLMIEDGEIVFLHRSRSRGTPVERLVEFITEFPSLRQVAILHTGVRPGIEEIKGQLAESLPKQPVEEHIYGPVLAALFGPTVLGVVAFEA